MVGERSNRSEVHGASRNGAFGSENVGTSNRKSGEIPDHRKPKVSLAMTISQGLVGPKPMAKAGGDGELVNIPALRIFLMAGRNLVHRSYYWIYVHSVRIRCRQIRAEPLMAISKRNENTGSNAGKFDGAGFQEKRLKILIRNRT